MLLFSYKKGGVKVRKELRMLETKQQIYFYFLGVRKDGIKLYLALPRNVQTVWQFGKIYDEQLAEVGSWYDWFPLNLYLDGRDIERLIITFKNLVSETWLTDREIAKLIFLHYEFYYQEFYLEYIYFIQKFGVCLTDTKKEDINLYNIADKIKAIFENKIQRK